MAAKLTEWRITLLLGVVEMCFWCLNICYWGKEFILSNHLGNISLFQMFVMTTDQKCSIQALFFNYVDARLARYARRCP